MFIPVLQASNIYAKFASANGFGWYVYMLFTLNVPYFKLTFIRTLLTPHVM